MRRLFKILLYLVILVAVLIGGAIAAFLYAPSDTIRGVVEARVEEATGRKLTLEGDIERSFYPVLGVKTGAITFANADWADSGPLLRADGAEIGVRLLPLLGGGLEVENAVLTNPDFAMEIAEDGRKSWELAGVDVDSGVRKELEERAPEIPHGRRRGDDEIDVLVQNFEVVGGRVRVLDRRPGGTPVEITDIALKGALPSLDEALRLTGSATAQGRPANLELTVDNLGAMRRGESAKTAARLTAEGVEGRIDGVFVAGAAAPQGEGDLKFVLSGDKRKTAWIRAFLPESLEPLGAVDIDGKLAASEAGVSMTATGSVGFKDATATLEAGVSGGADWREGGPVTTRFDASAARLFTVSWSGDATAGDGAIKGDLSFESADLRGFFDWLGLGPVEAPAGAFQTVSFKSGVSVSPKAGGLSGMTLTLDDSMVAGDLGYNLEGERPAVVATLESGPLDLRPFTRAADRAGPQGGGGTGGGASASGGAGGGWSKEPLELGALDLVDAHIDVRSEGLTTEVLRVGKSHVLLTLKDGTLVTEVKEMALYGGSATGTAKIDSAPETPEVALNVDVKGVALRPLLNDSAKMDWLEGTGALDIDITGRGASQDAIMRSLAGTAGIDFRDGAIIGYNLAALARNITTLGQGDGDEQKTDFAEMTASFQIDKGVADNRDFFMAGPLVRLTGEGRIDIGGQTIDYRATPKAVATLQGQGGGKGLSGIAFPVLITGPWADPSVRPDLSSGALDAVEGILTNPEEAGALFEALGGGKGGGVGEILQGVTGGGGSDGGGGDPVGGAINDLLGGGGDKKKPLGGLFGN